MVDECIPSQYNRISADTFAKNIEAAEENDNKIDSKYWWNIDKQIDTIKCHWNIVTNID